MKKKYKQNEALFPLQDSIYINSFVFIFSVQFGAEIWIHSQHQKESFFSQVLTRKHGNEWLNLTYQQSCNLTFEIGTWFF